MTRTKRRLEAFGALRALSCLSIIGLHCYVWEHPGYMAVTVFFMLSGFLLVYNYYDRTDLDAVSIPLCARFTWNKIKKIYPLHLLTLLFFAAEQLYGLVSGLAKPGWDFFFPQLANVLLIQSWFPQERIYFSLNVPSWYLSVCVFLYFMFPFVLKAVKRFSSVSQAVLASVGLAALQMTVSYYWTVNSNAIDISLGQLHGARQWLVYVFPLMRLVSFSIGCNLGYIFLKLQDKKFGSVKAVVFELLTVAVTAVSVLNVQFPAERSDFAKAFDYTLRYMPASIMLIIAFAWAEGPIVKLLTNRVMLYIGRLSKDIYLIHYPVVAAAAFFATRMNCSTQVQRAFYLTFVAVVSLSLTELYMRAEKRITGRKEA